MAKELRVQLTVVVGDDFDHDHWVNGLLQDLDGIGAMAMAKTEVEDLDEYVALARYGRRF